MLGTLGRLDPGAYRVEPSFRTLIDVAPFGISDDSPRPTARIVKGIRPGISGDDRLLLWGGGVWNWLDPLTPIRAVAELARGRDDVKLLFLALRHPDVILHRRAKEAVALARSLDVLDRHVFFNEQWVPYADRQAFLLEADLGISAHFDTLETRYAYRARLLDYFWAGLPTVTTRGDVLADLVVQRGLGEAVPPQDVDAWAAALVRLLDDPEARSAVRTRLSELRPELSWASAVKPLARIVHAQLETARGAHPWSRSLQSRNLALRLAAAYRIRGAAGLLKRQAKKVAARSRA
jgi:glycosyltransferase involved in cell wall biosynthesis